VCGLVDLPYFSPIQLSSGSRALCCFLLCCRYQYPLQPMEGVPLPPGIPGLGGSTDPLEAVLGPFPCARLRNLPYDAALEDILILFQGLVVIDVVISSQGDAFVIFANPMDFQMALQRSDRQTIGRRFVEIVAATRSEYYDAIAKVKAAFVVKLLKTECWIASGTHFFLFLATFTGAGRPNSSLL
jgi:hypothetical protein